MERKAVVKRTKVSTFSPHFHLFLPVSEATFKTSGSVLRDDSAQSIDPQIKQVRFDFETIICMPVLFVEFRTAYPQDVGVGVLIPAFHKARVSTDAACSRTSRCF
jgi:hypothetical protein